MVFNNGIIKLYLVLNRNIYKDINKSSWRSDFSVVNDYSGRSCTEWHRAMKHSGLFRMIGNNQLIRALIENNVDILKKF